MVLERAPLERLRSAYLEMPGLRLNPKQAARLCGLPEPLVTVLLASLAHEGFLKKMQAGHFVRRGVCPACE